MLNKAYNKYLFRKILADGIRDKNSFSFITNFE